MYSALKKHCKKRTLRGFSLGEVLLAAFVLTVGVLTLTALMTSSLRQSLESQNAIIAVELAQEGVELVRNVRDNDFAAGNDGFSNFSNPDKHCHVDYNDPAADLGSNCKPARGDESQYYLQYVGGFYGHFNATKERFSRYIYINYTSGSDPNAVVRSFVYWGGGASGMFVLADVLGNGDTTKCTVAKKCVFTEITLTSWR